MTSVNIVSKLKADLDVTGANKDEIMYNFNATYCSYYERPPRAIANYPVVFYEDQFSTGIIRNVYSDPDGAILALFSTADTEYEVPLSKLQTVDDDQDAKEAIEASANTLFAADPEELALKLPVNDMVSGTLVFVGSNVDNTPSADKGFLGTNVLPAPTPSIIGIFQSYDKSGFIVKAYVLGSLLLSSPRDIRIPAAALLHLSALNDTAYRGLANVLLTDAIKYAGVFQNQIAESGTMMTTGQTFQAWYESLSLSDAYETAADDPLMQGYVLSPTRALFENAIRKWEQTSTGGDIRAGLDNAKDRLFGEIPGNPDLVGPVAGAGQPGGGATNEEEKRLLATIASLRQQLATERASSEMKDARIRAAVTRADQAEADLRTANFTIQQLQNGGGGVGPIPGPTPGRPTPPGPVTPPTPMPSADEKFVEAQRRVREQSGIVTALRQKNAPASEIEVAMVELRRRYAEMSRIRDETRG